jgi:hypothetical protein
MLAGSAMLAWSLLESRAHRASDAVQWLARMAWVPAPMLACVHLLLPDAMLSATKAPWAILARHDRAIRGAHRVVVTNAMGHPVNWACGRTDFVIVGDPNEFDNELQIESERWRFTTESELPMRVQAWVLEGPVVIVAGCGTVDAVAQVLPALVRTREVDRELGILVLSPAR